MMASHYYYFVPPDSKQIAFAFEGMIEKLTMMFFCGSFFRAQALPTTKIIAIIIPIDSRGVVDHFLLRIWSRRRAADAQLRIAAAEGLLFSILVVHARHLFYAGGKARRCGPFTGKYSPLYPFFDQN